MSNYKQGGYESKYIITKTSGKPVDPEADYFVLRLDKDPHALEAIYAYATSVMGSNKQLSTDLMKIFRYYQGQGLPDGHIIKEKHPKHPFKG